MENRTCYIFAAGDFDGNIDICENDYIIAADAGYHHVKRLGLTPNLLIGDFDTIGEIPNLPDIIKYPTVKDYTDSQLALMEGIERGYTRFVICGAIGGKRLEHTLSNLQISAGYAEKGYDITLTDGDYIVKALHNGTLSLSKNEKGFISVFCQSGKAQDVTIKGLKYELCDAELYDAFPLGVSNEFIGKESQISVKDGTLIIMWQKSKY